MCRSDIIFLIDTSGSMGRELKGVRLSSLDFANRVAEAGVDCRLGLVNFAQPKKGADYNWEIYDPMAPSEFAATIADLRIRRLGGFGCYIGEPKTVPVVEAFASTFRDKRRLKIGVLISDEVGNDYACVRRTIEILQQAQIYLYVLGVAQSCHQQLAEETGGRFWDIKSSRGHADFSDLLDAIAGEITNLALR